MGDEQAARGTVSGEERGKVLDLPVCRRSDPRLCSRAPVSDREDEVTDTGGHGHPIRMLPLRGVLGMSIWTKSPGPGLTGGITYPSWSGSSLASARRSWKALLVRRMPGTPC